MQQDLISNQNFLSVIEQKKELIDQPAFKFANGDTATPVVLTQARFFILSRGFTQRQEIYS